MITDTTAIPTIEPVELVAGDTLEWSRDLGSEFSGWAVTYYLSGEQIYTIATTASVSIFTASVSSSTTASYAVGDYVLRGVATYLTKRKSIYDGKLKVLVDPSQITAGSDLRSHAKIVLDAVEEIIELRASRPESQYKIDGIGREYIYKSDEELIKLRQFYQAEYRRELDADMIRRGEQPAKNIGIRFNRVW